MTKHFTRNSVFRLVLSILSFVVQALWLLFLYFKLKKYSTLAITILDIFVLLFVIFIYGRQNYNSSLKTAWIILFFVFPFIGIVTYFISGIYRFSPKLYRKFQKLDFDSYFTHENNDKNIEVISKLDKGVSSQVYYLSKVEKWPVYKDNSSKFFKDAKTAYDKLLDDIKNAKKFIFMEYFAIEERIAFSELLEILKKKIYEGVEVRIIYDDVGSISFVNYGFVRRMNKNGIKCKVFNPVTPFVRLLMNNRDHRKITVIDGEIAYTGGFNIADCYFNITSPFGYWKDTGIRINGSAVNEFTKEFLKLWNSSEKNPDSDLSKYFNKADCEVGHGFIQPFFSMPVRGNFVCENVYLNVIQNSKEYVWITTPYLILDDHFIKELLLAAGRGVDVRIVTPGIPDHRIVHRLTKSYFGILSKGGVKIYKYIPGFIHAKQMLSDGEVAIVGTINLDYRSFYHHFENGVLLYKTNAVKEIKNDFEEIFNESKNLTPIYSGKKDGLSLLDSILRVFSTLM